MNRFSPFARRKSPALLHEFFAAFRILVVALCLGLILCAISVPFSFESWLLLLGAILCTIAVVGPGRIKIRAFSIFIAGLLVSGSVLVHDHRRGNFQNIEFITGPSGHPSRSWNSWVQEADIILLTARFLPWIGGITDAESENLIPLIKELYTDFRSQFGDVPSPLVSTFLFQQSPQAFDLVYFPAPDAQDSMLIFLHGSGGNWPLLCWIVSEPASKLGISTLCPSVGPLGDWGNEKGEAVVREAIRFGQSRGKTRFILAGLSAGGIGAARLAKPLASDLRGLMLLFGISPGAARTGLPALLVYGLHDERITPDIVNWALKMDPWAEGTLDIERFNGNHFALIQQRKPVQDVLYKWLEGGHTKELW